MKSIITLLPILATAEALNVVSMSIGKNPAAKGKFFNPRGLGKRSTITESLLNNVTAGSYLATVKVGTPPQTVSLALDTGSSDVWVVSQDAIECKNIPGVVEGSCPYGTFDANSSSTFNDTIPGGFDITYQDNTGARGDWFTDDFTFGNATVKNLQMGLGTGQTTINIGIMGIGYDTNEATSAIPGESEYPNLIDELVSQGQINIEAYSLWLDELNSSTGSILFGGIDTHKYTGDLISIPLQIDPLSGQNIVNSFTVALTGLTTSNGSTTTSKASSDLAVPVLLDSGTTLTYLPDDLANQIYNKTGALNDLDNSEMILISCDILTSSPSLSINFQFGSHTGPNISVPISELIFSLPTDTWDEDGESPPFENTCMFGIFPQSEGPYLLGDTFLRSAYVVYDLKNNEVGLAQTDFDSDSSHVVEIQGDASSIPLVSGVASGVTVAQTATGLPGVGVITSGSLVTGLSGSSFSVPPFSAFSSSMNVSVSATTVSAPVSATSVSTALASSSSKIVPGLSSATSVAATSTGNSALRSVSAFDMGGLVILGISGLLSFLGAVWFVL